MTAANWWESDKPVSPQATSGAGAEWWANDAPADQATPGARGLGMGTRNVVEGFTNLASIFTDPVASALNLIPGVNIKSLRETVPQALTDAGLPSPETQGERVMARAQREMAGVLPTMGTGMLLNMAKRAPVVAEVLTTKPFVQLAGAGASGTAAQAAQENGAGPWWETGAAVLGGLTGATLAEGVAAGARGAKALVQPFTQTGRERIAADTMLRNSADPEGLANRLTAGMEDQWRRLPNSPATTAQVARDPGLAVMENALRSDATRLPGQGGLSGAAAFRDVEATRNAARQSAMAGMADDLTPEIRGAQVRDVLAQQEQAAMPGGPLSHILGRLNDAVGENAGFYGTLDDLARQRSAHAAPLYEKAFQANGIHTDRLAKFLDDPISREGMRRGLEIQRLEALAQGKPFNPSDYAITRFNDAGDPVIGTVPNMRLLDATKRGFDEILEGYRDPTSGRLALDQRGRAIESVRKAFIDMLDGLNPDYKAARQAWAGPSQSMNALTMGREALTMDPEILGKQLSNLAESDRDFYRAGAFRALQDKFAGMKGPEAAYAFLNNQTNADRLAAVFGRERLDEIMGQVREQATRFGRDETGAAAVGQVLRRDQTGAPVLPDASVAKTALASPQSVRQTLKAAGDQAETVKQALRGQFIESMRNASRTSGVVADAGGNVSDVLSPAQFRRFLDSNKPVAREIFEADQLKAIDQLAADFAETSLGNTMGRARGSDTAQNLSVGNVIARASGGLISPGSPLAQTVAGIGPLARWVYEAPEAATRELLVQAAIDPRFARILLLKAGPDAVREANGYVASSAGQRLRQSLAGLSTRAQVQQFISDRNQNRDLTVLPQRFPIADQGPLSRSLLGR